MCEDRAAKASRGSPPLAEFSSLLRLRFKQEKGARRSGETWATPRQNQR